MTSNPAGNQITTLTFFRYQGLRHKIWAFKMMQFAHSSLANLEGQSFYKLMGSGKGNGFNPFPDWSVYCLLQIWEDQRSAEQFFDSSSLMQSYHEHTSEVFTIYMKNIKAHGEWSGESPFEPSDSLDPSNPLVAVITRARIRTSKLITFWRYVPTSEKPLIGNSGLLYTKGVGEVPIINMATFSIWDNIEDLKNFAYSSPEHRKAIQMTRDLNWYSEELFSRFQPFKTTGTWADVDLTKYFKRSDAPLTS